MSSSSHRARSTVESYGPHRPGSAPGVREGDPWGSVAATVGMSQLVCRRVLLRTEGVAGTRESPVRRLRIVVHEEGVSRLRVYPGRPSRGQRLLHGSGWARLLRDGCKTGHDDSQFITFSGFGWLLGEDAAVLDDIVYFEQILCSMCGAHIQVSHTNGS